MAKELIDATELIVRPDTPIAAEVEPEDSAPSLAVASQWKLMWWRFRKHRLAVISLVVIVGMYLVSFCAGFFAHQATDSYNRRYTQAPPQTIHWFDNGAFGPFVYGYKQETDPRTLRRSYMVDEETKIPLGFFVQGDPYKIGLHGLPIPGVNSLAISSNLHFFGQTMSVAIFSAV
jgi:peptide/nickel transport system permease protein